MKTGLFAKLKDRLREPTTWLGLALLMLILGAAGVLDGVPGGVAPWAALLALGGMFCPEAVPAMKAMRKALADAGVKLPDQPKSPSTTKVNRHAP